MTGNGRGYDQDTDGDGTPDLAQTRTHNRVNEINGGNGIGLRSCPSSFVVPLVRS